MIETLKVMPWGQGQGDFVIIDKVSFDPEKHTLYSEKKEVEKVDIGNVEVVREEKQIQPKLVLPIGTPARNDYQQFKRKRGRPRT